jgi:hypothetical protein
MLSKKKLLIFLKCRWWPTETPCPNSMVRRGNVVDADTGNVDSDLTGVSMNQLILITHILNHLLRLTLITTMNLSSVFVVVNQDT